MFRDIDICSTNIDMHGNDKHCIMYNGLSEEGKGGYGQEVIIYKANLVGIV